MSGLLEALGLAARKGGGGGGGGGGGSSSGGGGSSAGSVAQAVAPPTKRADSQPGGTGTTRDPRLEEIDEIINDPEKRLKALADRKIPRFAAEFDAESSEVAFLKDLESGTKKAKEYVDFIQKASEYAKQYGDLTQSDQIKAAATSLKKVTSGVLGGLSQFAGFVAKAKELVTFYQALDAFADASLGLDMRDRASVTAWAKSIKTLWNAGAPFVDWVKSKALSAAFAGSKLAGVASATLSIVGAQIFVGISALNAGLANVNAYIDKMNERMRQIEEESGQRPRTPKPQPPAAWKSRGDEAFEARQKEDAALREQVYRKIDAEKAEARRKADDERKAEEARRKAEEAKVKAEEEAARRAVVEKQIAFRDVFFPKLYISTLRAPLLRKLRAELLREIRKSGWGSSPEFDCYECFDVIGEEDIDGIPYPFPIAASKVGIDGAKREIAKFSAVRSSCDDFERARDAAHAAYERKLAAAGAATKPGK